MLSTLQEVKEEIRRKEEEDKAALLAKEAEKAAKTKAKKNDQKQ